jgi:hypothetical protein
MPDVPTAALHLEDQFEVANLHQVVWSVGSFLANLFDFLEGYIVERRGNFQKALPILFS